MSQETGTVSNLSQRPSMPAVICGEREEEKKKRNATKGKFNWASEPAGGHLLRVDSN